MKIETGIIRFYLAPPSLNYTTHTLPAHTSKTNAPLQPTSSRSAGRFSAETNGRTIKRTQSLGLWHGWISCTPFFVGICLFENGHDGKRPSPSAMFSLLRLTLDLLACPCHPFFSSIRTNNTICSRLL